MWGPVGKENETHQLVFPWCHLHPLQRWWVYVKIECPEGARTFSWSCRTCLHHPQLSISGAKQQLCCVDLEQLKVQLTESQTDMFTLRNLFGDRMHGSYWKDVLTSGAELCRSGIDKKKKRWWHLGKTLGSNDPFSLPYIFAEEILLWNEGRLI